MLWNLIGCNLSSQSISMKHFCFFICTFKCYFDKLPLKCCLEQSKTKKKKLMFIGMQIQTPTYICFWHHETVPKLFVFHISYWGHFQKQIYLFFCFLISNKNCERPEGNVIWKNRFFSFYLDINSIWINFNFYTKEDIFFFLNLNRIRLVYN